jgi:hypothetical protein
MAMTPNTQALTLTTEMQALIQRAEQGDKTALEPRASAARPNKMKRCIRYLL